MATFNVTTLRNWRPKGSSYYVSDNDGQRGRGRLMMKVQPSGNKVFCFQYHVGGKPRYISIGAFTGELGQLQQARAQRNDFAALLEQDIDPREHLTKEKAKQEAEELEKLRQEQECIQTAEEEARLGTVEQLFIDYTDKMREEGKRTADRVLAALRKDALPVLGATTKARDVTSQDIVQVLHKMIARGARTHSNRVRSYLMTAFNAGIQYDNDPATLRERRYGITVNPVSGVPKQRDAERVGLRDLSPEEIQQLFAELPNGGFSLLIQIAIRFCFATGGQRPNEVLSADWSEIDVDNRVWEMPGSKTKNKKNHPVPLTDYALLILSELPGASWEEGRLVPPLEGGLLFPNRSRPDQSIKPTSISRAVKRYCERTEDPGDPRPIWGREPWVPRDIRRTCKTRMGALRIGKEIRDRINNHAINDVSARHYDRYDYLDEKREALEIWCGWLCRLTVDKEAGQSNVIELSA